MTNQTPRRYKWWRWPLAVVLLWNAVRFGSDLTIAYLDRGDIPCSSAAEDRAAACSPVSVDLQVRTVADPSGGASSVWYRASIKNDSRRDLYFNNLFLALDSSEGYAVPDAAHTHIAVSMIGGEPLAPASADYVRGSQSTPSGIFPYRTDNSGLESFKDPSFADYIRVPPGAVVNTNSEVLDPYRVKLVDVRTERWVGTAGEQVRVNIPRPESRFARPPEGFRRLLGYDLSHPGRYKVRLEFRESCLFERLRAAAGTSKDRVMGIAFLFAHPSSRKAMRELTVIANSPYVEFEVAK